MRAALPVSAVGSPAKSSGWFGRFASYVSKISGKPAAFFLATVTVIGWAAMGPLFHYSDTWQLVINTGTTIVTFLMVFLIQATQNRDTVALQLKLDELLLATEKARDHLVAVEEMSDDQLEAAREEMKRRADMHSEAAA